MSHNYVKAALAGLILAGVAGAQAQPSSPQGVITEKVFLNIGGGTAVADLTGNAKFPNSPDITDYVPYFELYATGDINTPPAGDIYNNSGAQIVGYFYPPSTGDYIFYLSADDGANLYLSTDANPANKKLIAQESGWSGVRSFTSVGGGSTVEAKDSSLYTGTQWPTKDPFSGGAKITLQQGNAYYIEALEKEGGGGDNLSVAVSDPNGAINAAMPIPGQYLASFDKSSGAVTITTPPTSITVDEGKSATFSVVANGTPPYTYQWISNNVAVAGVTGNSLTIPRAYRSANGAQFKVTVTGAQGAPATSAAATLTINNDTVAPTLASAAGSANFDSITLTFSEPLDPATAETAANYKVDNGVSVSAAKLGAPAGTAGDNRVVLTTSKQGQGALLTITVNNVKDVPGNAIAANSKISFKTAIFTKGWASYQRWDGDTTALNTFTDAVIAGTQAPPSVDTAVNQLGGPWGVADNYNSRVFGWFTPPSDGNYVFYLSSDDNSYLFLSTDETPANKKVIAYESGWSNQYQWQTVGGGSSVSDKRSDQFSNTSAYDTWPTGGTITLSASKKYYIEISHHEGGGGDGSDATFVKEGDADPAQSAAGMFLKGDNIGTYLDPNGANVDIATQPADATQQENRTATFTVVATGTSAYGNNVSYQWQQSTPGGNTFTDIPGATGPSYTTPLLSLADNNTQFQVACSVPTFSKISSVAKLTVVPDTFPPKLEAAGAVVSAKTDGVEIGIRFDENVDGTTAGLAANYSLSKGTVTGVRYQKFAHTDGAGFFQLGATGPFNGGSVVLTTSGLADGDSVNVTVKNVKDIKGNAMSATGETKGIIIRRKLKWSTVGGDDYLQGELGGQNITPDPNLWMDDVVAYSNSDFDLISSGTANWNAYDELTTVTEEVTGDFDKIVRVEYQDPTSQWARAGMIATPALDTGMTRAQVSAGAMQAIRYLNRVNPKVMWDGGAGNNGNEADWRDNAGGNYGGTGAGNPAYPNAWLRMTRIGQTFTSAYSSDGKNWTTYGAHTFTAAEPMPDKIQVGIYYCPEFGNNSTGQGVGHSSVAKFRQYGSYTANPPTLPFGIGLNFGADEPAGANGGILPSIGTAGAPSMVQANWNNLSGASGTQSALVADNLGSAQPTAASVTWSCPNTWSSTGRGEENLGMTGNDKILYTGYLDTGGSTTTTVEITGIPTDLTAKGYDVIVYATGGVPGRGGGYAVTDASDNLLTTWVDAQGPNKATTYVKVVPTPGQWAVGNYIVFSNLKASSIKVLGSTQNGHAYGGTPRAPINAIQLVPTGGGIQPPGAMTISLNGANVTVDWAGGGTLQSAPTVLGPWTDIGTTKPYTTAASAAQVLFRVRQ